MAAHSKPCTVTAEEHYGFWSAQLPETDLVPGMFGENLTTNGLIEDEVFIGDRYSIGSALLQVSQPRMPCYKLGIRFNRPDIVKRFWQAGRPGIYFSIAEEGDIAAGDPIEREIHDSERIERLRCSCPLRWHKEGSRTRAACPGQRRFMAGGKRVYANATTFEAR